MPHAPMIQPAMIQARPITRRLFVQEAAALASLPLAALPIAAWPGAARAAADSLTFQVWRNGAHVGEHEMRFTRDGAVISVVTHVAMLIRLGPVPVFRYRHEAREAWRADAFATLRTDTNSNGQREQVTAAAEPGAVVVETLKGLLRAPAGAAPLTHWNTTAFAGPMFNPQTGKLLKIAARKAGPLRTPAGAAAAEAWTLRGEATIDNWYDAAGDWLALRGQLPDRSWMEYRRS